MTIGRVKYFQLSYDEFVCNLFGIKPNPDYPLASLHYKNNHQFYYLYADPVYLSLQRDTFFLEKKLTHDFNRNEIKDLCDGLNEMFQTKNNRFISSDEGQLLYELKKEPQIKTTLIEHIKPQSIDLFMPRGDEAMKWHAFMNEIQMFLFEHAINKIRINRGNLPVNSIWFSGGGILPKIIEYSYTSIFSNSNLVKKIVSLDSKGKVQDVDDMNQENLSNHNLIVLDEKGQIDSILELIWYKFRHKKIDQLSIYLSYQDQILQIDNTFINLFKIWKKADTLKKYFNAY